MTLRPAEERDTPLLTRLLSLAFGTPREKVEEWVRNSGHDNFRIFSLDGTDVSCCLRVPMGHFFGARSVPVIGVAGVAVAPEARGSGIASRMMAALFHEIHAEGTPLSSLYPATLPLYRRGGYEQAGHWCEHRIALSRMELDPTLPKANPCRIRAYDPARDLDAIKACYSRFAATMNGYLDRGDYVWGRVFHPRAGESTGFILEGPSSIEGYTFLRQERLPTLRNDVYLTDIAWATPAAAHTLIDFLRGFQSVGEDLVFSGGPIHPIEHLLREQKQRVVQKELWMLRLVDVPAALMARGYSPHARCSFQLDVTDEGLTENAGTWLVEIEEGRCSVKRGNGLRTNSVRLHVRALATAYAGLLSATQLRATSRLEGDDAAVAAMNTAFASSTPGLPDMF